MGEAKQEGMALEEGAGERGEAHLGRAADTRKEDQAAQVQQQPRREPAMHLKPAGKWM